MREGWETVPLGQVFDTTNIRLGQHADEPDVFSVTKYDGFVPADEYFGKRIASAKLDTYKVVEPDEWAYSTIHIDEGSIARNRLGRRGVVSPMYTTMRLTSNRVHPYYAELLLRSPRMLARYSDAQQGSINRRRSLPWKVFAGLTIPLPSLDEQRRIVDLLGALDDTIAAAEDSTHQLTQAMVHLPAAVVRRGHDLGWESGVLKDVLGGESAIRTGPFGSQLHQSDYVEDGPVAVVMPANLHRGRVDLSAASRILETDAARLGRHLTRAGDILWSRRGDVTRFAVIDDASEGSLCGTGCFLLRPEEPGMASWLEVILSSPETGRWLVDNAVGATMANLNRTILGNIPVVTPPLADRMALSGYWSSLRTADRALAATITTLRNLRSNLLTVLLSGEHPIPESYNELMEDMAA